MASRKDYNALAEVLNELQHYGQPGSRHIIAAKMAKVFAADNERFDEQRFYEACDIDIDFAVQAASEFDAVLRRNAERTEDPYSIGTFDHPWPPVNA